MVDPEAHARVKQDLYMGKYFNFARRFIFVE